MRLISLVFLMACLFNGMLYAQDNNTNVIDNVVPDIVGNKFQTEITNALELGYLSKDAKGLFNPDGNIKTQDYLGCIKKAATVCGLVNLEIPKPGNPTALISKQDAITLLVNNLLTPEQIKTILLNTGSEKDYLADMLDAIDVNPAAAKAMAVAVYKGWVPDKEKLWADRPANRAYTSALLTRAVPNPNGYTGLAVIWNGEPLVRLMFVQFGCKNEDGTFNLLYPDLSTLPSFSYIEAPGVVSYSKSLEEAKERRVGVNPLVVEAQNVEKTNTGGYKVTLSNEDITKIRELNQKWLFLKTWRVALVTNTKSEYKPI